MSARLPKLVGDVIIEADKRQASVIDLVLRNRFPAPDVERQDDLARLMDDGCPNAQDFDEGGSARGRRPLPDLDI